MPRGAPDYSPTVTLTNTTEVLLGSLLEAVVDGEVLLTDGDPDTTHPNHAPTSGRLAKDTSTSPPTYYLGDGNSWEPVETGFILRLLTAGPTAYHSKSADPASQEYGNGSNIIATYDAGEFGTILPLNFNPADPTDADLTVILIAEFHDGTTDQLASVGDGTAQTFENLVDAFESTSDDKAVRKLVIDVTNGDTAVTEDIGATVTNFMTLPRGAGSLTVS